MRRNERGGRVLSVLLAGGSVMFLWGCTGEAGESDRVGDPAVDSADVETIDRRPALLGELGSPDAFVITVDEIDGEVSRFESWTYFDARTRIDLADGELLWDVAIDALPEGSWLPLAYEPAEFTMLSTVEQTMARLADVEVTSVDASEVGVDGAELWAGEQLLMGFVDDRLVYVETFPLAPGEQEVVE